MLLHRKQSLRFLLSYHKYEKTINYRYLHPSNTLRLRKPPSARKAVNSASHETTISDVFHVQENISNSNRNFYGIEGDEGVIYAEAATRSGKLIQDSEKAILKPKSEFRTVSFGAVRLDVENKPSYYVRYSDINNRRKIGSKLNAFVENDTSNKAESVNTQYIHSNSVFSSDSSEDVAAESRSYLDNTRDDSRNKMQNVAVVEENGGKISLFDVEKDSFIDNCYFPSEVIASDVKEVSTSFKENHDLILNNSHSESNSHQSLCQTLSGDNNSYHPQKSSKTNEISVSYIDECYFPKNIIEEPVTDSEKNNASFIDEQYFNKTKLVHSSEPAVDKADVSYFELNAKSDIFIPTTKDDLSNCTDTETKINKHSLFPASIENTNIQFPSSKIHAKREIISRDFEKNKIPTISNESKFPKNNFLLSENATPMSNGTVNAIESNLKVQDQYKNITSDSKLKRSDNSNKKISNLSSESQNSTSSEDQPVTAFDFVKKLRAKQTMSDLVKMGISAKKEKKLDSKGFRILKHQVPSLMYFTRDEMLELLQKSVLFSDDDIIILNKPYNLVIHESSTTKDKACLSMYLNDLAKILDPTNKSPELFTVHRLDKETTGCLLLARNEVAAQNMKSLFAQRKIIKTYWIVTTQVPNPMEGIIDIPISEGKIENKSRMVLHPDLPSDVPYVNHSKCGKRAVTEYSVIAVSGNAALVEVKPITGIKHQIRVHFGFGLACPILGDHKYSHLNKLVPQKLPSDLLQKLCVRQSKVRHIPLHIHSKHILIPQYSNGRNLFVTAPLSRHMSENLRFLKFKK